jgi:hypothetical protein
MNAPNLFTPVRLSPVEAPNRSVMAPLTQMRAGAGRVPIPLLPQEYAQRAAGLTITGATTTSQQGAGHPNMPGSHTHQTVAGLAAGQHGSPELNDDHTDFIVLWDHAVGRRSKRIDFTLPFCGQGEIPQWLTNRCAAYSRGMGGEHFSPSENQMRAGAPPSAAPVRLRQNPRLHL